MKYLKEMLEKKSSSLISQCPKIIIILTLLLITLLGCTTVKYLQCTNGSRADGLVQMSYEAGMFEKPQVQWGQAQDTASGRCQAWGYSAAQAFDTGTQRCLNVDGYGNCNRWRVDYLYQCVE